MFCSCKIYIIKQKEEAWAVYYTVIEHSEHLRNFEKCRKHPPAARVFYISPVFDRSVLHVLCFVICKVNILLNHFTDLKTSIQYLFFSQRKQEYQAVVDHELCSSQIYASLKRQA